MQQPPLELLVWLGQSPRFQKGQEREHFQQRRSHQGRHQSLRESFEPARLRLRHLMAQEQRRWRWMRPGVLGQGLGTSSYTMELCRRRLRQDQS